MAALDAESSVSTSSRSPNSKPCRKPQSLWGVLRACRCASTRMSTPAPIRRFRPRRKQIRRAAVAGAGGTAFAAKLKEIELAGADVHIGSQLTDLAPFDEAFSLLAELVRDLRADGHDISHVDLGGGLGIPRSSTATIRSPTIPDKYAEIVRRHFGGLGCKLVLEPGRLIVGNAGILVTRVIYVKHGDAKTFVIVDAGMNDLIRPTLYDAWHDIIPVRQSRIGQRSSPTSSSLSARRATILRMDARLRSRAPANCLCVLTAGAYGAVQSGAYNTRPLHSGSPAYGRPLAVIRPRPSVAALIAQDHVPAWLA